MEKNNKEFYTIPRIPPNRTKSLTGGNPADAAARCLLGPSNDSVSRATGHTLCVPFKFNYLVDDELPEEELDLISGVYLVYSKYMTDS